MENKKQTIFEIPEQNMATLQARLEKLSKKATKLKSEPISFTVLRIQSKTRQTEYGNRSITYYTVEISGAAPIIPGYQFLGTLNHYEAGNVIRSIPGVEIPESYRIGSQKCDHCQTKRARKDTYIVQNTEQNKIVQVGKSCLKDFIGHRDPKEVALFAEFLLEVTGLQEEREGVERIEISIHPERFLQYAAQAALKFGYVSRSASNSYSDKSGGAKHLSTTSEIALKYAFPSKDMQEKGDILLVTDEAKELVKKTIDYVNNLPSNSNYEHNLKLTLSKDFLTFKDFGIAASAIGSYQKFMGIRQQRQEKNKPFENSEYFGEIGKRQFFNLTFVSEHVLGYSSYGFNESKIYLYKFVDKNNNVAVWKTTKRLENLQIGKAFEIKATVKKHSSYQDIKQTELTRCSVEKEVQISA